MSDDVEVIQGTASVAVDRYEGALLQPAAPLPEIASRFGEYRELCQLLLDADDFQKIAGGEFLKKSGWRKLATAMGVDLVQLRREVRRGDDGRVQWAEFTYRAVAPNGRTADAEGACSVWERRFSKPDHDVIATAETRAKSRACSDLFGLGALSAEEVDPGPDNAGCDAPGGTEAGVGPPTERELRRLHVAVRDLARDAPEQWRDPDALRHRIIANATSGRVSSAKDLTAADMAAVFAEVEAAKAALGGGQAGVPTD